MAVNEKLQQIAENEDAMCEFVIQLNEQIATDDEPFDKKFRRLKEAYEQHPDIVDDLLMTLCGWRMETLADNALTAWID